MADKTIEVVVDTEGGIKIEGKGFSGPECERATRELENALGDVESRTRTGDYYRREEQKERAR